MNTSAVVSSQGLRSAKTASGRADWQRAFDLCARKTRRNIKDFADQSNLGTWSWAEDGDYSRFKERFFEIGNWTSSFFTGMTVMVCGVQELEKIHAADTSLLQAKSALLEKICSDDCLDFNETCQGVLKSAYGSKVAYSSWGDYFLMEAVSRELGMDETFW